MKRHGQFLLKTALIVLLVIWGASNQTNAQSNYMYSAGNGGELFQSSITPSANTAAFMKYGGAPVDHYTGSIGVTIPIYTYKDQDFELPISLVYSSDGYKPNVPVDITGLGWHLQAGGAITRNIRGIADDHNGKGNFTGVYDGDNPQRLKNILGFYHLLYEPDNGKWFNYEENYYPYTYYHETVDQKGNVIRRDNYESLSDLFNFKMPGHSGNFMFGYANDYVGRGLLGDYSIVQQGIQPISENLREKPRGLVVNFFNTTNLGEYKFEVYKDTDTRHFQTITLYSGDGYKYTFGDNNGLRNHSRPHSIRLPQAEYEETTNNNPQISWPLREMSSPNGRKIEFIYSDVDYAGTPIYYQSFLMGRAGDFQMLTNDNDSLLGAYTSYRYTSKYDVGRLALGSYYNSRLDTIAVDNVIIIFRYRDKTYGETIARGIISEKTSIEDNRGLLTDIFVYRQLAEDMVNNASGKLLKHCKLTYSEQLSGGNAVALLKSVEVSGEGIYYMSYYREGNLFPEHGTVSIDSWGYYNLANNHVKNGIHKFPNYGMPYLTRTAQDPSPEDAMQGMLKLITYPTKGATKFEYEGHDYNYTLTRRSSYLPALYLERCDRHPTGGLRIKKITDYSEYDLDLGSGTIATQREYKYETKDSNGKTISSGVSLMHPFYIYDDETGITQTGVTSGTYPSLPGDPTTDPGGNLAWNQLYPDDPISPGGGGKIRSMADPTAHYSTEDGTHIEYSHVQEYINGLPAIEYEFSTFKTHPDRHRSPEDLYPKPWEGYDENGDRMYNRKNDLFSFTKRRVPKLVFFC